MLRNDKLEEDVLNTRKCFQTQQTRLGGKFGKCGDGDLYNTYYNNEFKYTIEVGANEAVTSWSYLYSYLYIGFIESTGLLTDLHRANGFGGLRLLQTGTEADVHRLRPRKPSWMQKQRRTYAVVTQEHFVMTLLQV